MAQRRRYQDGEGQQDSRHQCTSGKHHYRRNRYHEGQCRRVYSRLKSGGSPVAAAGDRLLDRWTALHSAPVATHCQMLMVANVLSRWSAVSASAVLPSRSSIAATMAE